MIRCLSIFAILFLTFGTLSAQMISFDRKENVGDEKRILLRLKLSREYLFMIPGAGKPIRKLETMDLVLLTGIKVEEVNRNGFPVILHLSTEIPGGTLNGRRLDPALLKGRKIRADLKTYPCVFTPLDGKPLSEDALVVLSALFRQQQNIPFSGILGKEKKFRQGGKWLPDTTPILKSLADRKIPLNKKNLKAQAMFENKFKVDGIECTAIVLNLSSVGTHAYDFQVKTRLILPVKKEDGGVLRLSREGVEVVDRKMLSSDFAASGSAMRITTKEQLEVTRILKKKTPATRSGIFF